MSVIPGILLFTSYYPINPEQGFTIQAQEIPTINVAERALCFSQTNDEFFNALTPLDAAIVTTTYTIANKKRESELTETNSEAQNLAELIVTHGTFKQAYQVEGGLFVHTGYTYATYTLTLTPCIMRKHAAGIQLRYYDGSETKGPNYLRPENERYSKVNYTNISNGLIDQEDTLEIFIKDGKRKITLVDRGLTGVQYGVRTAISPVTILGIKMPFAGIKHHQIKREDTEELIEMVQSIVRQTQTI